MKLAACYTVWDDWDLLEYSVENIRPLVDEVIIVGSEMSNHGERSTIPDHWKHVGMGNNGINIWIREPIFHHPMNSETDKRNYGLSIARERENTHYIAMDADEFYDPFLFTRAWSRFLDEPKLKGLVVPCNVYFKYPNLCLGRDTTLVPFIHELTPTIKHEFNKKYPYAWDNKGIRIDPTRSYNILSGVQYTEDVVMEHFSWVRKDIMKKIRNSTARANLKRSTIVHDYVVAKEGEICNYYGKRLYTVENRFNLPYLNGELLDQDLQLIPGAHSANKSHVR